MPAGTKVAAVEAKLKKEYGDNDHAVYGVLNKSGLMRGSKPTKKGLQKAKKKFIRPNDRRKPTHTVLG